MDPRKKKVVLILCIASVVLVWRIYVFAYKFFPTPAQADAAQQMAPPDPQVAISTEDDHESQVLKDAQMRIAQQDWGRNPFDEVPWAARTGNQQGVQANHSPDDPTPPSFLFTGVSMSGDQWLAAIQGRIVRVGDVYADDYEVIDITRHSVTLATAGWSFRYELGSPQAVVQRLGRDHD